ncbi:ribosomal protein S6 kinase delta-1-like isoform X2 [Mizuhopecten yessoensis]|uniref:Ribosomal protein S6 kinase delta-1 n=1 Tax=Mizuhopecten yessoensis TaxID=6573 RepID=A0A210Q458_MIZYE|nr:ribosomal protein S6 kinase delta-1-like isoform X2 [Mizuhopecten yessoensis]OWF43526.1 Ribosomal protein S6 kinase delta-1 [Mizuhopecten yessoensis]
MAAKSKDRLWQFDVSDPTKHPDGFTVYKVSCKVFQIHSPESLTEILLWKRYNDFKNLFRVMLALHRALHRKEEFPKFAKPKLFGRFEDSVIEERRISALQLLNFIGNQPHLHKSKAFQEFLKGGKQRHGLFGSTMKPSKLDILSPDSTSSTESEDSLNKSGSDLLQPVKHPPSDQNNVTDDSNTDGDSEHSDQKELRLEGVWNFPQIPDNISLNSYDDDVEDADVESNLSASLPDTDIAYFDPLSTDDLESKTDIHTNGSWLFAAMNTCAEMDTEDLRDDTDSTTPSDTDAGIQIDFDEKTEEMMTSTDTVIEVKIDGVDITESSSGSLKSSTQDLSEFDPLRMRSESSIEYGKGDLDLSHATGKGSASSLSNSVTSSATSSPVHKVGRSPHRVRSQTGESVSTMDLGGKEDYIYMAANQICQAQDHEANGRYELAFSSYKSGVGILLQGVQGDKNRARRDAVRRKTAQYLIKAEDLYNRHLAKESLDQKRWAADGDLSPLSEVDPSLALLKGSTGELKNYKVLGTVDKVLLVMDKSTDDTYIMKTIHKSSTCTTRSKTILPVSCPYMVGLHKFYETDNAIHLLLQYAAGGKLWTYIGAYLQSSRGNPRDNAPGLVTDRDLYTHAYMGQKIHSSDNSVLDSSKLEGGKQQADMDNVCKDKEFAALHMKYTKDNETCVYSANKPGIVPTDSESNVPGQMSKPSDGEIICDKDKSPADKKRRNHTLSSISSLDNQDMGDTDISDFKPCQLDHKDFQISDILENTKSNLDCFSINSIESNEGVQRMDSNASDNTTFESIPEESEVSPKHKPHFEDDVFDGGKVSHTQEIRENVPEDDADIIVKNAKELIKSVERTLSVVDGEVEEAISPKKLSDFGSDSKRDISSVQDSNDLSSGTPTSQSISDLQDDRVRGQDSASLAEDYDSSNETSIYDLNRSNEGQGSDTSDGEQMKAMSDSPKKDPSELEQVSVELLEDSKDRSNTLVKPKSDPDLTSRKYSDLDRKESRSSTFTEHSLTRHPTPPKKLSLNRMNSKDLCRSASMERELTSPLKTRHRNFSGLFQQLDLATSSPEQVHLPESCIQQWAAEMVVALSRLHAEGIFCRDLKPNNILLGERGHILLTYFCQISTTETDVDFEAVDQLYVAPEVRSICGYTDVCDWWSLGSLLYELLTGRSLLSCHPGGITSHTQLYIPESMSSEARGLLHQLLCYNPRERLGAGINGAEEIKAHPFFSGVNWNALENQCT